MKAFMAAALLLIQIILPACTTRLPEVQSTASPSTAIPQTPSSSPTTTPTETPVPTPTPTPLPQARILTADEFLWEGDYIAAIREYQAALAGAPSPEVASAANLGLGRIALAEDRLNDALTALRSAIDAAPSSETAARAHFFMGQSLAKLSRFSEAAVEFAAYLSSLPGRIDSYVAEQQADALASAGDYSGALSAYQAAAQASRLGEQAGLQIKIAQTYYALSDFANAVATYQSVYDSTSNDFLKAQADYGMGAAYIALGQTDAGYQRYLDAVNNYPRAYSSYQALVDLIDAGVEVDDLARGLVDYFAGQYTPALNALDRYLVSGGAEMGTALHYKSLILRDLDDPGSAIIVWQELINSYPEDRFWPAAWEETAYTEWAYLNDPATAAQTLLSFVNQNPGHTQAASFLFQAARYLERADLLIEAANTWDRVVDEYPAAEDAYRSLFLAGISRYRLDDLAGARTTFQRGLLLSTEPANLAASYYWIGKIQAEENNPSAAEASWQQAVSRDPTGYYSEKARDRLLNRQAFTAPDFVDYGFDLAAEKLDADTWMRSTFSLSTDLDLNGLGEMASDSRIIRGQEFWALGLYNEARLEFENIRGEKAGDPATTYRLAGFFNQIGLYRSAIMAARNVLTLANLDDAASLNVPAYFNHIRFAPNFRDLVFSTAQDEGFSPLFIFSLMRQESLFEGFVVSSAGARGLMQIMPATGEQVAANMGWPENYRAEDLYRPAVSIRLGTHYLAQQVAGFNGDVYAALAAYNGGPGNAIAWNKLAGGDQDLLLEVIRIQESRDYLMRIFEIFSIYRRIYGRTP